MKTAKQINRPTIAGEAVALDCKGKAQTKRMRLVIHAGKRYEVDESGRISYTREDGSGWQGSEDWVFLGLTPINCVYPRIITWDHIKKHGLPAPLYYKNGKCRYTVADRDHGTMRTWGNPAVASIHLETVNA